MKIEIEAETTDETCKMIFTNETLDNDNFVDIQVEDKEYTIEIDAIYASIKTFRNMRDLRIEREKGYDS